LRATLFASELIGTHALTGRLGRSFADARHGAGRTPPNELVADCRLACNESDFRCAISYEPELIRFKGARAARERATLRRKATDPVAQ